MIRCMNVDEAREVCKDRSRWHSIAYAYPWVYVCRYISELSSQFIHAVTETDSIAIRNKYLSSLQVFRGWLSLFAKFLYTIIQILRKN